MWGSAMRLLSLDTGIEVKAFLDAVYHNQAVIEFALDGTILSANANFLAAMGYELAEIKGRNHRLFVDPVYAESEEYREFWRMLNRGQAEKALYRRLGKNGREVWIEASYNPIRDKSGKLSKVVKFAVDVTAQKQRAAELEGAIAAIDRSQAMIEFAMDGTILSANANFLATMGYALDEVKGKHHRMFVDPASAASQEYADFWAALRRGEYQARQFRRLGKNGREVWIEASYNPILDPAGRPFKVIKLATDISEQVGLLNRLKRMIDTNFAEIEGAVHLSGGRVQNTSGAIGQASANVQAVASAAEELAASISEISSSMVKSQAASEQATRQAAEAGQATQRLSDVASSMNGIVNLIQGIASKINLLSLNAAIESARAGEAGRGFAVVANEVKGLANQAARATEEISREISGVQRVAAEVVASLDTIQGSISLVQDFVGVTAAAVEEQSAVTRDMSMNMQAVAQTVEEVSIDMTEISGALGQVEHAVGATKEAANVLVR